MSKKAKKAASQKPSSSLPNIIEALDGNDDGMSTGELAEVLGLSISRTREILSAEVKRGNLQRQEVEDDGATVFKFFNVEGTPKSDELSDLMATGDEIANEEQVAGAPSDKPIKEAKRGRKSRTKGPNSGRGNPEAKKSINPQQTLEDKKDIAKELGFKMTWAGRLWHIGEITMTSREIASFTLEQFRKKLGG
jgi:hypothetical protein